MKILNIDKTEIVFSTSLDKINKVCEFFEIDINGTQFESTLASFESGQTFRRLITFINAMNMIANIELF